MDPFYADKEEEKNLTRGEVREILPIYTLLCAKEKGKTYGYEVVKKLEKDFHMLFSASEVYPTCWSLEKDGFLISESVKGGRGKPRREYHIIEPKTSKYLDRVFRVKNTVMSRLDIMRRNIESSDSGVQVSVALPEAMAATRLERWRVAARHQHND